MHVQKTQKTTLELSVYFRLLKENVKSEMIYLQTIKMIWFYFREIEGLEIANKEMKK